MPFDLLTFVAKAVAPRLASRIATEALGDQLQRDANSAIASWSSELPTELRGAEYIGFWGLLNVEASSHSGSSIRARQHLEQVLRDEGVPTGAIWSAALLEAWMELRDSLPYGERAPFLRLSDGEAQRHFDQLSPRIVGACRKNGELLKILVSAAARIILDSQPGDGPTDFRDLERLLDEVDRRLLRHVRDHRHLSEREVLFEYRRLMDAFLMERAVATTQIARRLQRRDWMSPVLQSVPQAQLQVRAQLDDPSVTFRTPGFEHRVSPSALIWPCLCGTVRYSSDGNRLARVTLDRRCPVHSLGTHGMAIADLFARGLVEIESNNVSVLWRDGPELWPPSIDSLGFATDLRDSGILGGAHSVLDVGCGTGFLGLSAAKAEAAIRRVVFTDWLLTPLFYSAVNWWRDEEVSDRCSAEFRLGIDTHWSFPEESGDRCDVLICNPPYLPLPSAHGEIGLSDTVAGTQLLAHVIEHGHHIADRVVVSFSALAQPEVERALNVARRRLKAVGPRREVPFRVPQAMRQSEYVRWLLSERGMKYNGNDYFQLWHSVQSFEVV